VRRARLGVHLLPRCGEKQPFLALPHKRGSLSVHEAGRRGLVKILLQSPKEVLQCLQEPWPHLNKLRGAFEYEFHWAFFLKTNHGINLKLCGMKIWMIPYNFTLTCLAVSEANVIIIKNREQLYIEPLASFHFLAMVFSPGIPLLPALSWDWGRALSLTVHPYDPLCGWLSSQCKELDGGSLLSLHITYSKNLRGVPYSCSLFLAITFASETSQKSM